MQRYNNFSNPPNIRRSFFSRASPVRLTPIIYRSAQIAAPIILQCHIRQYLKPQQKRLPNNAPSIKTCSPLKDLQTPPKTRSFELRVQRYNDFLKPPNFQQTFFRSYIAPALLGEKGASGAGQTPLQIAFWSGKYDHHTARRLRR